MHVRLLLPSTSGDTHVSCPFCRRSAKGCLCRAPSFTPRIVLVGGDVRRLKRRPTLSNLVNQSVARGPRAPVLRLQFSPLYLRSIIYRGNSRFISPEGVVPQRTGLRSQASFGTVSKGQCLDITQRHRLPASWKDRHLVTSVLGMRLGRLWWYFVLERGWWRLLRSISRGHGTVKWNYYGIACHLAIESDVSLRHWLLFAVDAAHIHQINT